MHFGFRKFKLNIMEYEYGYDSDPGSSEYEVKNDKDITENTVCNICDFKAKTIGGLKTHVTKKYR